MRLIDNCPLVSIIIPAYNPGKWLIKCLDSVISQTYINFECIIFDDGSTDGSGLIMDEYAKKDKRLSVIHGKNEGPCCVRNKGIAEAKGDWIVIVDSDDWIESGYIEGFLSADCESQMVIQSIEDYLKDHPCCNIKYHFPDKKWEKSDIALLFSEEKMMKYGTTWSRMYKRDIIQKYNLRFNPSYSSKEDVLFAHQYLAKCDVISTVSYCGYHYIYHSSSLAHTVSLHMSSKALRDVSVDIFEICRQNKNLCSSRNTTHLIEKIGAYAIHSSVGFMYCGQKKSTKDKIQFIRETKVLLKKYHLLGYLIKRPKYAFYILPSCLIHIIYSLKK